MKLDARPPVELVMSLDDPRPAVRDKVVDLLVQAGEPAVGPLIGVRQTHASPEVRASAVFALGRIAKGNAGEAVRAALSDSHFLVRIAAARMAGPAQEPAEVAPRRQMGRQDGTHAR